MRVKQRVFQTLGFNGQDRRTLFVQKVRINMKVNNDKIHRTNVPHILVWFILNRAHIHNTVQAARLQNNIIRFVCKQCVFVPSKLTCKEVSLFSVDVCVGVCVIKENCTLWVVFR